ncbi:MAG: phosphate ABC transporter permease subunit PstC [Chloroflexi bacterium]|nr:phosphate ABC transporter permease subunit PstC [Chloroflexota bacterium]MCI0575117.1 phosphate ABC transporter permease subunit PstC [Chloroflexota bacterium]MCI0646266.1 phosphate ABC transporter permease subunit PstC [Chloroflexota bacterium]MCI0728611.1 phosphate ABC transporter permease subunit PstC [Chloroflexota bacterium]
MSTSSQPATLASPTRSGLNWGEFLIERTIRLMGVSAIVFIGLIFFFLVRESAPTFVEVDLATLFNVRWYPNEGLFGLAPLVLGSLAVTIVATLIALPLGLATAVYVAEVAPRWLREILKPFIEVLAGIPSVVLGFIGMQQIAPWVLHNLGAPTGLTVFSGALLLAYMALPTIVSVAEDALDAVPRSLRDAGLALGATGWQTIYRVTLPAARSGVLTAVMLGIGRAIGETMAVMMVTGNAARIPLSLDFLFRPARTMTATIAAEMGEVAAGSEHYHVLFTVGMVLFLITFLINLLAASVVFRQRRQATRILS